jgi:hypothetical protein
VHFLSTLGRDVPNELFEHKTNNSYLGCVHLCLNWQVEQFVFKNEIFTFIKDGKTYI